MSKKSTIYHQRKKEEQNSRIKRIKEFILNNTSASYLNNIKWYRIFELIESKGYGFNLKILESNEIIECKSILELESSSILIDSQPEFIYFLEIQELQVQNASSILDQIEEMKINFEFTMNQLVIKAYSLKAL
jgi:hypothetical protein